MLPVLVYFLVGFLTGLNSIIFYGVFFPDSHPLAEDDEILILGMMLLAWTVVWPIATLVIVGYFVAKFCGHIMISSIKFLRRFRSNN